MKECEECVVKKRGRITCIIHLKGSSKRSSSNCLLLLSSYSDPSPVLLLFKLSSGFGQSHSYACAVHAGGKLLSMSFDLVCCQVTIQQERERGAGSSMSDLGEDEKTGSYSIYFAEGEALAKQKQFQKAIESFTKASLVAYPSG